MFHTIAPFRLLRVWHESFYFIHHSFPAWCPSLFSKKCCLRYLFCLPRPAPGSEYLLKLYSLAPGLPHRVLSLLPPEAQESTIPNSICVNQLLTTSPRGPSLALQGGGELEGIYCISEFFLN